MRKYVISKIKGQCLEEGLSSARDRCRPEYSQLISHCGLKTVRRRGKMQEGVRIEKNPKDRSGKASEVMAINLDFIAKFLLKWKVTGGH